MKQAMNHIRKNPLLAGLLPAMLVCFLYLMFRNAGVYPIVFIDEWIYSSATRLLPAAQAQVPSYLYFKLYGLTNYCGDSYLDCNRLLNALLYVAAAPFIYLLTRRVAPAWTAVLVAVASVLAPANALTPFFMPEAAYFVSFWLICWIAMQVYDRPVPSRAAVLGGVLGLAAMVKLHAIFLLPSAAVFLLYAAFCHPAAPDAPRPARARQAGLLMLALLGTAAAARFGGGYLLAGDSGLHLFGNLYANQVSYTARSHLPLPQVAALALNNLRGHLMLLALQFGVPLAALAATALKLVRKDNQPDQSQAITVLSVLMLGAVMAVTIAFTASITGLGVGETASRIHTRYYHFALPLLLICGAAAMRERGRPATPAARLAIGALLIGAIAYAWFNLLQSFTPSIIDSPELRTVARDPLVFALLSLAGAAALAAWMLRPALGARLFVLVFLPLSTWCCGVITAEEVRKTVTPDAYSKAGLFVRHYLDRWQTDRLVIVAEDIGGLHRARFFIENANVAFLETAGQASVDWNKLPDGKTWVLVIGDYALPEQARIFAQKDNMTLLLAGSRKADGHRFDFSQSLPNEYVQRVDGLAGAEPWGSWSDGPSARIQFALALPQRLRVTLSARAFGPNAGKEFGLKIGKQTQQFKLGESKGTVVLDFDTDGKAEVLEIVVPAPASPAMLSLGEDQRQLGIGIESLLIEARP